MAADPRLIEHLLQRAMQRSAGGWVAVDASRNIGKHPQKRRLGGRDWVCWRTTQGVVIAPNQCPHMGAELHCGRREGESVVCPWHGLALGPQARGDWRPVPTFDDGVLVWARILSDESPSAAPILASRPPEAIAGVVSMEARCEPQDIVANRLDPWHGAHYHPHSFARLRMLSVEDDVLALRVAYRVAGPLVVEVDCTFHSPTRRSIVMTIVDGDGAGSVVETHATPLEDGRSQVLEATLATSSRAGFVHAKRLSGLVRPFIERRARRLWVEDVAYAERRYALRTKR